MAKKKKPGENGEKFDVAKLELFAARRVLLQVLGRHPELASEIAVLAQEAISNPTLEDLAGKIEGVLNGIDAGAVELNSGRGRGGYREPEEAAADLLVEAMEPFFDQLESHLKQKDDLSALTLCEAIIVALYRFKYGENFSEIEEYAEDYPEETADWAARLWRSAGNVKWAGVRRFLPELTMSNDFVQQHVPEWDWLLDDD